MKKFLSLLMALTMLMACTACFGSAESASDPAAYDGSEVNITFYNTMGSNLTPVLDTYIQGNHRRRPAQHRLLLPGSRRPVQPRACGAAAGCLH